MVFKGVFTKHALAEAMDGVDGGAIEIEERIFQAIQGRWVQIAEVDAPS